MPRFDDTDEVVSHHPFDGIRERVSTQSTLAVRRSWRFRLAAVMLATTVGIVSSALLKSRPAAREPVELAGHERLVNGLTFSPDGRTLASSSWDFTVRLWDRSRWDAGHPAHPVILPHGSTRFSTVYSPDGALLVSTGDRCLTIWSCRPDYRRILERAGQSFHSVSFSPDGRTLAVGAEDGSVRLWDMPDGQERSILRGHAATVRSIAFSPDGKVLVSGSQEGRVVLWDALHATRLWSLVSEGATPILALAFSPDGKTLGLAKPSNGPGDVVLVNPETGAVRSRLAGHTLGIHSLAFSPDGRILATAGVERCIKLWNLATERVLATFRDEIGWVKSVAFSPDGAWLAFAGQDESVRLLDVRRIQELPSRSGIVVTGRPGEPLADPANVATNACRPT